MTATVERGSAEELLQVNALHHEYEVHGKQQVAIDSQTFSVRRGEFVSIVGPSGCGKTTLLRAICGLTPPTSGAVRIGGELVTSVPKNLAMVFQDYSRSLYPWKRVRDNIEFPLQHKKLDAADRRQRVDESLSAVGLDSFASHYPWQLSGGMQQRVAIARALAYRPEILLMDEPYASVDAQTRSDLEDLLLSVQARFHMTVVFVTHDIDESVYLADRVVVLSKSPSRVVQEIVVDLPRPRDQITTKELPAFVHLRGEVARLVRHGGHPAVD